MVIFFLGAWPPRPHSCEPHCFTLFALRRIHEAGLATLARVRAAAGGLSPAAFLPAAKIPAPAAPRRRLGKRFGRRSVLPLAVPHGVAASVKCRKSCSYFCREQSRQSRGHSRSYVKGCQCRYRQKEQNLVCIFYACCNAQAATGLSASMRLGQGRFAMAGCGVSSVPRSPLAGSETMPFPFAALPLLSLAHFLFVPVCMFFFFGMNAGFRSKINKKILVTKTFS